MKLPSVSEDITGAPNSPGENAEASAPKTGLRAKAARSKTARKVYWTIVVGLPLPRQGKIDMPLAKLPGRGGEKMAPEDDGKAAVTYYSVIENAGDKASFVALLPVTGRTHQLRAHCLALGTPILGDGKYGGAESQIPGVPNSQQLVSVVQVVALGF